MSPFVVICIWFLFACIGGVIGERRGRPATGFFAGLLLGPIGWIWLLCDPSMNKPKLPPEVRVVAAVKPPSEALLDLKKLLDAGAISQADYDAKKAELLARL